MWGFWRRGGVVVVQRRGDASAQLNFAANLLTRFNDNDILIDEALQLTLLDVPSQSRISDFLRDIFQRQPVLPVVVRVEVVENRPLRQHQLRLRPARG